MQNAKVFVWAASAMTALYEILVSSPWWTGARQGSYDMLMRLAVPSIILLIFAYYLLSKRQQKYSAVLAVFIVCLQLAILFTIFAAARGILP